MIKGETETTEEDLKCLDSISLVLKKQVNLKMIGFMNSVLFSTVSEEMIRTHEALNKRDRQLAAYSHPDRSTNG
jgi:hypothetical protein